MDSLPKNAQKLIDSFNRLPGIGEKTASRLVLYLLHSPDYVLKDFGNSLLTLKSKVKFCVNCNNLCDGEYCSICKDKKRNNNRIIVVEDVLDLLAFENIDNFDGVYHVLGGLINPMIGIGPEDISINKLLNRVKKLGENAEIIIATNPNLEGESTAMYIKNEINKINKKILITRIARGLPTGADLDYADKTTLLKSLEGRIII